MCYHPIVTYPVLASAPDDRKTVLLSADFDRLLLDRDFFHRRHLLPALSRPHPRDTKRGHNRDDDSSIDRELRYRHSLLGYLRPRPDPMRAA